MDFIEYNTQKYVLYKNLKKRHMNTLREYQKKKVTGTFNLRRHKEDVDKLVKLVIKYKDKIKVLNDSHYGDILIFNYKSNKYTRRKES